MKIIENYAYIKRNRNEFIEKNKDIWKNTARVDNVYLSFPQGCYNQNVNIYDVDTAPWTNFTTKWMEQFYYGFKYHSNIVCFVSTSNKHHIISHFWMKSAKVYIIFNHHFCWCRYFIHTTFQSAIFLFIPCNFVTLKTILHLAGIHFHSA